MFLKLKRGFVFRNFICAKFGAGQEENLSLTLAHKDHLRQLNCELSGTPTFVCPCLTKEKAPTWKPKAALRTACLEGQSALETLPSSVPFMMETQSSPTRKGDALNTSFT